MKKLLLFFTALLLCSSAILILNSSACAQSYQWAKRIGSTNNDEGYSIATDGSGNVYITGYFSGTADFDPGAGAANLTSVGGGDIFFAKYDSNGNYLWAKRIGGTGTDVGRSIATDSSGNLYLTGWFNGTADFDPGAGTANLTSAGSSDIFFAKYDSNGNYIWAKSIGSTNNDEGNSIATYGNGNVYITGFFRGTADFDPDSSGNASLTSVAGSADIFFAKYDSNGNYVWAKSIGGSSSDYVNSIVTDSIGNVYITGVFDGTADFDPGSGTVNLTSAGGGDIFFARYDSNGNYVWAKSIGSGGADGGNGIATDGSGNVYITGLFQSTADFDPGTGIVTLTSAGVEDIFFAKYDSNGNYVWAIRIGSTYYDYGYSIVTDGNGNVYITGYFAGTADFDPGAGTANLTSAGNYDIFFAKYDSNGNYLWAKRIGSTGTDIGYSIATDGSGKVYITGYFAGTADFDPDSSGTANLTSAGNSDIFFAKYSTCNLTATATSSICNGDSIFLQGNYQTTAGTYYDTLSSVNGCDSIIATTLTVNPAYNIPATAAICSNDSIFLQGNYQTTAATYYDTLYSVCGSDSVIETTLTVNPTFNTPATAAICSNDSIFLQGNYQTTAATYYDTLYSVCGSDSVIETMLIVNSITSSTLTETACNTYTLNSQTYTTSGTYTQTLTNAAGCDSVITLNLSINSSPAVTLNWTFDTVCVTGIDFDFGTSGNPVGGVYSGTGVIPGSTIYSPSSAGAGQHTITYTYTDTNGCSDSAIAQIFIDICAGITSITDNDISILIFPNPNNGTFTIELNHSITSSPHLPSPFGEGQGMRFTISNILGETILKSPLTNYPMTIDLSKHGSGIYFLQIISEKGNSVPVKLVVH